MKNIRLFITFAVLMACQSQVEEPQTDYQQISDGFHDMFETSLNLTSSLSLISVEENTDEYTRIGLELGDISKWTQEYLNSEYFKGLDENLDLTLVLELDNYQRNLRTSDVLGSIVDTTTIFSENQKDIFNSLVTDVLNLDDLS